MIVCNRVYMQKTRRFHEGLQCFQVSKHSNLFYLKVLWFLPRSSALREGCRGQPGPRFVSQRSLGLRHKYPASTATSPLRSDRSLHLRRETHKKKRFTASALLLLFSFPPLRAALRFTLLQLYVSCFHNADFAVVDGTGRL